MPDPRRLGSEEPVEPTARDGQAEALLVAGLDRYFAGEFDEAINLWTRVLFLDRTHARARAYIDRARTALAERQRRADEMLHATGESLAQGDVGRARALLTEAEQTVGNDERAAGLRQHLERLESVRLGADTTPLRVPLPAVSARPARVPWRVLGAVAAMAGAVSAIAWLSPSVRQRVGLSAPPVAARPLAAREVVAPLSGGEVAMIRARTLVGRGRLAEALSVLDRVPQDSDQREAADSLRLRVQQLLTAAGRAERVRTPVE